MYIENIVIGKPIANPKEIFSKDAYDWDNVESEKTYYTEERFLPKILVSLGLYPSISEIRRNKPELMISFEKTDFIDGGKADKIEGLKVSKKRRMWILVGE